MIEFDEKGSFELTWRGHTNNLLNGTTFCELQPFSVSSYGLWEKMTYKPIGMGFWEYPLPLLEIIIFSAMFLWLSFDFLFKKLRTRIPKFASMMLVGVVLNQTFLLKTDSVVYKIFFPNDYRPKVPETLGAFGFAMYWFLKGVSMDVGMLKMTRTRGGVIGIATIVVPVVFCYIIFISGLIDGENNMSATEYRAIIILESMSSFTGINVLLKDLNINHSEFGRIAQSSAMVSDLVAFFMAFSSKILWDFEVGLRKTAGAILFIVIMIYIIRPIMLWIIRQTPEERPVKDIYIYAILLLAYLSLLYWKYFNLYGPLGMFVLGLTIPDGPPLGSAIVQRFESFTLGVLMPLFGSLCMKQVNIPWLFQELWNLKQWEGRLCAALSVILIVLSTKLVAATISAFATKMPLRDSILLAIALSNKGFYELSYYLTYVELQFITPEVFTVVATSLLFNSLIIPITLDFLYAPSKRFVSYQKRNLLNLKPDSELPTLVCIHKADHIKSITNLVEVFRPSKDSPLGCYVLHLIELVGQDCPTFISHQMQKPKVGNRSCSDNVITSFSQLHQNFAGSMSLHMFTSVSFSNHMHEDICWLALDRSLSLILLPFHRTWSLDRSTVISDDNFIRNLNLNVLKQAPCSVGILVYRNPIWVPHTTESCFKVCLIFMGGNDDREALALTNRMRLMNPRISLTFLLLTQAINPEAVNGCKKTLNTVDMEKIMKNNDQSGVVDFKSVKFINKRVVDGTETSNILRSLVFEYDLFIVGRNNGMNTAVTEGLTEWIEFEELGVIGDILASPDYSSRTSVLVVQQQDYRSKKQE